VNVNGKVLEELFAGRVRLARHVKNVSNAKVNHFFCLEGSLVGAHVDSSVDLNQLNFPDGNLTVNLASAHGHVGEASAGRLFILGVIVVAGILKTGPLLVLIDWVAPRDVLRLGFDGLAESGLVISHLNLIIIRAG
jgi:hypothetical protein